ncbi:MAG: TIGR03016 family PEP-CTERM system-associated outer membrane protein [Wenzhouxiangella sp.]|nr:MAG: TIGR03016 family PEP-CTERM system-associated outer membrane protein [Wenzhouxiangella sp.]
MLHAFKPGGWVGATTALCLLAVAGSTAVADGPGWDFTPFVELGQSYSDNIALNPRGDEDGDFATTLEARIGAVRQGAQSRLNADYRFLGVAVWSEGEQNGFHQLRSNGAVEVVPDRFAIEASASYDQRQRSRSGVSGDLINLGVDRFDVFDLQISPVYTQTFGNTASTELRYTFGLVDYDDSAVRDNSSTRHQVRAELRSGPAFSLIGWELTFNRSETDFDDGVKTTLQTAEALARWQYSPRLNFIAAVGRDDNTFEQELTRSGPSGNSWRTGVEWAPSARTSGEAFFGERFFGRTFGARLDHRLRHGRVFADYSEDVRTVNVRSRFFAGQQIDPDLDPDLIDDEDLPDVFSGVYLSRSLSIGMTVNRPRSNLTARIFRNERDFDLTRGDETGQGLRLDAGWQWMPRTRLFGDLRLERRTFADARDRTDNLFTTRLGVGRQLGPKLEASLDYLYRQRNSSGGGSAFDYRENRITAAIARSF